MLRCEAFMWSPLLCRGEQSTKTVIGIKVEVPQSYSRETQPTLLHMSTILGPLKLPR